jgi:uncharacterized membrane protein
MRKISSSTWLLMGLAAFVIALGVALLVLTPPERWNELRSFRQGYGYVGARGDAAGAGPYIHQGYRFRGLYGHPPFVGLTLLVLLGAFFLGRSLVGRRRSDASLSILEERFAEGKIDQAEFERRRSVLNGSRGTED